MALAARAFVEKTPNQLRVLGKPRVQNLHSRATFKQRVLSQVHFPEAALAQQPDDAVVAKNSASLQRHAFARLMLPWATVGQGDSRKRQAALGHPTGSFTCRDTGLKQDPFHPESDIDSDPRTACIHKTASGV